MEVLVSLTGLSPSLAGLPRTVLLPFPLTCAVRTPKCTHFGLGSSGFARRYFRYRQELSLLCFFLFLRLLRCFSSPGSLCMPIRVAPSSAYSDRGLLCRVSPFRHLRLFAYMQLPAAFRSLSRLSSALCAKASALCPSSLNLSAFRFPSGSLPLAPSVAPSGFWSFASSDSCHCFTA